MELDYGTYEANKDPFLEERATNVLLILQKKIQTDQINIKRLIMKFDKEGKGGLNLEEFKELVEMIDETITTKEAEYIFKKCD